MTVSTALHYFWTLKLVGVCPWASLGSDTDLFGRAANENACWKHCLASDHKSTISRASTVGEGGVACTGCQSVLHYSRAQHGCTARPSKIPVLPGNRAPALSLAAQLSSPALHHTALSRVERLTRNPQARLWQGPGSLAQVKSLRGQTAYPKRLDTFSHCCVGSR